MVDKMGLRIKEFRTALGMTLSDLGEKVGVGASTVRKWETGHIKDMRSDKIQKVAAALGVTPASLMGWDLSQNIKTDGIQTNNGIIGQANGPVTIANGKSTPSSKEEIELLRIYRDLDVRGRMRLLTVAMDLEAEERGK